MSNSQKVAIVVGASSGLGKAMVDELVKKEIKVFALARSIDKTNFSSSVFKIAVNIRDLSEIDRAFAEIDRQTSKIDVLVNCAGRGLVKPLNETTREDIMDVFGINLKGNIYIAQEAYKRMLPHKSGHIINVSSTSGLKGKRLETIYCASKWGLRGFTEALKDEALAYNIRVSGIYPGGMKSENFWKAIPGKDMTGYMEPSLIAQQIMHLIESDPSILPSELIIERR